MNKAWYCLVPLMGGPDVTVLAGFSKIWGSAWWSIDIVSVCGSTMCLSQLSLSEVQGSEKNRFQATRISIVAEWERGLRRNMGSSRGLASNVAQFGRDSGTPIFYTTNQVTNPCGKSHLQMSFVIFLKVSTNCDLYTLYTIVLYWYI